VANEFKVKNGVISPALFNVANSDLAISATGTGKLKLNGLNWPAADGTSNYVLKTDGAGNLSWAAQTGGGGGGSTASMISQDFSGTGSQTAFTLSSAPVDVNYTLVQVDGVLQNRGTAYSVSGTTLTFTEAPASGATIEVTTLISGALTGVAAGGTAGQVLTKNSSTDYDTVWATAGGASTKGTGTVNFGSFPGSNESNLTITGQSQITTNAKIQVYVMAESTADHTVSDHTYLPLFAQFTAGNIAAGTGFTIYGRSTEKLQGTFKVNWEWSN
jgi:hypothetical protein